MVLKPVASINTVHTGDENPDRDHPLYGRLSEIQQESCSTTQNSNVKYIPSSADDHTPDTPAINTESDHSGDNLMVNVTLNESTSRTVNNECDCTVDSDVGD